LLPAKKDAQMKKILEIPRPKSNSFIVWEHLMKSAIAFTGTFAMLFFGPIIFGGRKSAYRNNDHFVTSIIKNLFDHPLLYFGLCVLAVAIINAYIVYTNRKIKYTTKIEFDDEKIQLE
jgi:hypothetical protein